MFFRTTSSALAIIALAAPALADVTPAEVWQNWIDYYKANGYTVTEGARDEAGETLTLKDVVFTMAPGEGQGSARLTVPQIQLTATGDGKVRTTMAETSPFEFEFKDSDDQPVKMTGAVTMKDAEIISAGSAADMTHDTTAAEIGLGVAEIVSAKGTSVDPFKALATQVASQQRMVDGDLVKADGTLTAAKLDVDGKLDDKDPEMGTGAGTLKATFADVKGSGAFAMPKGVDIANDMNAALKGGLDISGSLSTGTGSMSFDYAGKDEEGTEQAASGTTDVEGFEVNFGLSAAGMKYQGSGDKATTQLKSSDMPFPINYTVESGTFDMQMPIMKSDTAEPFKFAYSIGGLTVGDEIWNLFDAGKKLPRDPASLDVDVTGLAKVTMDLFDAAAMSDDDAADPAKDAEPAADGAGEKATEDTSADSDADGDGDTAAMPDPTEQTPFQPTEVTINKLFLEGVGAKVDASGALTVPADGSIETPVGKITARLEGINGLIDNLVAIGVVPGDQVAGVRMMLAMFAKPAPEGGDALVSEFEFKEGGQIFANGQQVK